MTFSQCRRLPIGRSLKSLLACQGEYCHFYLVHCRKNVLEFKAIQSVEGEGIVVCTTISYYKILETIGMVV